MRAVGLRSEVRRKYRVTTDSKDHLPVATDLLERNFTTNASDKACVSEIIYEATQTGLLYLTVVIDLLYCLVVGWNMSKSLSHEIVVTALKRAIRTRCPEKGVVFNSDRGVQYVCNDFRKELDKMDLSKEFPAKWDNLDNAVGESFFGIMKTELVYHERYEGHQDTLHSDFWYTLLY